MALEYRLLPWNFFLAEFSANLEFSSDLPQNDIDWTILSIKIKSNLSCTYKEKKVKLLLGRSI